MALTLADIESRALDALMTYGTIECLSPDFDADWASHGQLSRAAEHLAAWASSRELANMSVEIVTLEGRTPVLLVTVESTSPQSEGTVVLYGHMDKQPPLGEWSEGLSPYTPVRRGNRLFARGLADDGYATFGALLALEDLEARGIPHARCVVLIEASEESGSPDLEAYLDHLAPRLGRVELLICLDSGALTYDRLWITTSLRGVVSATVRVDVLERGQHSGSASGVAPSSFRVLRQLLDRVEESTTGEIKIDAFHADIPHEVVAAAHALADEFGDITVKELPFVDGVEPVGTSAAERLLNRTWRPTLSVTGMGGIPSPADAGNVLRPYTEAVISLRLPPTVRADVAAAALTSVLTTDVPSHAAVTVSVTGADGWSAPTMSPWLRQGVEDASVAAFGVNVGYVGEGGTIPFLAQLGSRYPDVQFVATGVLGPGSNAHGIDEMLDLDYMTSIINAVGTIVAAHGAKETL